MTPLKVAVLTAVATLAGAGLAEAGSSQGKVRACSSYGNGCYTAPVRQGKWGREMRLRGGTWIDCRGDCRRTLREETVDFWETQQEKAYAIPR